MSRKVAVYRYKARWPLPGFLPARGTREAIATLDGCIPLGPTEREVAAAEVDAEGFLRFESELDGFDSRV
jgi:hypothetical protein